jgi:hypothetical protein
MGDAYPVATDRSDFIGVTKSKEKRMAVEESISSSGGFFRTVSDLMCKIGLGADDCKNEMALAEFVRKHHAFCDLQTMVVTALERLPHRSEDYRNFDMVSYETLARRARSIIKALHALAGVAFDGLFECVDDIDRAVGKALSSGEPVEGEIQDLIMDRIGTFHFPMNPNIDVSPEACGSFHDIFRFVLEASRNIMFDLCIDLDVGDNIPKQLVAEVPMQYWIVDLSDGIKDGAEGKRVHLSDITSLPMHALWEGLTAVPWAGPPPVNAKGFLSVMFQCTRDPCLDPGVVRPFAKKNHIIISKRFCNLTSRLGFHHTTAEAFVGGDARENYASFEFKGGAACIDRRERRVHLISRILKRFGFYTDIDGDDLLARIDARPAQHLLEHLKILGYLMTHTRQLDMVMCNEASVDWHYQEMLSKMSSFIDLVD